MIKLFAIIAMAFVEREFPLFAARRKFHWVGDLVGFNSAFRIKAKWLHY